MTNQSLRARFRLGEDKAAIASQVIAATIDAKLIKLDESVRGSRKFARYQPFGPDLYLSTIAGIRAWMAKSLIESVTSLFKAFPG